MCKKETTLLRGGSRQLGESERNLEEMGLTDKKGCEGNGGKVQEQERDAKTGWVKSIGVEK